MNSVILKGPGSRVRTVDDHWPATKAAESEGLLQPICVLLIDPDAERRAVISEWLSNGGFDVHPFDNLSGLFRDGLMDGVLVVADSDGFVSSLVGHLRVRNGEQPPVIAYAEKAAVRQIVHAMRNGAAEYFEWPADKVDMIEAILGARENLKRMALAHDRQFTDSELAVLDRKRGGLSTSDIAAQLGIPVTTVDLDLARIRLKLASDISAVTSEKPGELLGDVAHHAVAAESNMQQKGAECPVPEQAASSHGLADHGTSEPENRPDALLRRLSIREKEVLRCIVHGMPSRIIAETLEIRPKTVGVHRSNILRKMNLTNSFDAVRIAIQGHLI